MRKAAVCRQLGHRSSVSAQGRPGPEATRLSTLQWWKWANCPAQTLLFTVPGNRRFAMEKFLIVPIGTGHKLHNTKGVFLRLLADLCTRCASTPGLCAISEDSFHFFSGVMSKGGLSSSSFSGHEYLKFSCVMLPASTSGPPPLLFPPFYFSLHLAVKRT